MHLYTVHMHNLYIVSIFSEMVMKKPSHSLYQILCYYYAINFTLHAWERKKKEYENKLYSLEAKCEMKI